MKRWSIKIQKEIKKKNNQPSRSDKLDRNIDANIRQLNKLLDEPADLMIRECNIGEEANHKGAIAYIDGLINKQLVQDSILGNLQDLAKNQQLPKESTKLFEQIYQRFISISTIEKGTTLEDVANAILSGKTVFFLDGRETVLLMDTKGGESRSIEPPATEMVVRGPRAGFVENLGTNLALLRRSLQTPDLRFKTYQMGRRSKRSLIVAYVDGVINPAIVKEVSRRLETVDIDDASESAIIEQWIEDSFLSPFPQLDSTERLDKASSALLQGKVVILLDGTPFVLIAPVVLGDMLKSPEDYYQRWISGSLLRLLRCFAAFSALFLA
ncbi:spore germination protein [Siminovitchia sediminis]|uniref:Spore germination protein n=1 Tax=Siminovitchia sediminis TaxID=1274353 RepID=A0ABW4KHV2_9BACI